MTNRVEIPKYFCGKILSELVTGIHVKPVIRTIAIISFIHLVNGVPVEKEKVAPNIQFRIKMKVTKDIGADVFFNTNVLTGSYCYICINSVTHMYCWIVNNERLYVIFIFPVK